MNMHEFEDVGHGGLAVLKPQEFVEQLERAMQDAQEDAPRPRSARTVR